MRCTNFDKKITPAFMALMCRWRSRPQHHKRKAPPYSITSSASASKVGARLKKNGYRPSLPQIVVESERGIFFVPTGTNSIASVLERSRGIRLTVVSAEPKPRPSPSSLSCSKDSTAHGSSIETSIHCFDFNDIERRRLCDSRFNCVCSDIAQHPAIEVNIVASHAVR